MTKQEALTALRQGKTITHIYFSPNEFIKLKGNKIEDENGYLLDPHEFWAYRQGEVFDDGWEEYEPKKKLLEFNCYGCKVTGYFEKEEDNLIYITVVSDEKGLYQVGKIERIHKGFLINQ